MDASRARGSAGVSSPGAAAQGGSPQSWGSPRGFPNTSFMQKSHFHQGRPSPRSTLSPLESPTNSFESSPHASATSASHCVPCWREGRNEQGSPQTGTCSSYDVSSLRSVTAQKVMPKSNTSKVSSSEEFSKHRAAEANAISRSASVAPQSYDLNFLKQVANEAQALPRSSTAAPSAYDINFLKQVAAQVQALSKSQSTSVASAIHGAAGPVRKQLVRNSSRDDMFVELVRGRDWTTIQGEWEEPEDDTCGEELGSVHSNAFGAQVWEQEVSHGSGGHTWEYEEQDFDQSDEEGSIGGDGSLWGIDMDEGYAAPWGLSTCNGLHGDTLDGAMGHKERTGIRLQRNTSKDDMCVPMCKPTWQDEGVSRGGERGSPSAKKLSRMRSKDDMYVSAPKANWGSPVSKSRAAGGSPGSRAPEGPRRSLARNMSKDDMCLPAQKSRFHADKPRAVESGPIAKPQKVKHNRTSSKCDLSISGPKPAWELVQRPPMKNPAQRSRTNGLPSARTMQKKLGQEDRKDDVELVPKKSKEGKGMPRPLGPGSSLVAGGVPAARMQSKAAKKGSSTHEVRAAGGAGVPVPRNTSRAGPLTPKAASTPKGHGSAGTSRGAVGAGTPKGLEPWTPRAASKDAPSRALPREKSCGPARAVSKGAKVLGRLPSKDDMFVDILRQQQLQEEVHTSVGRSLRTRGSRGLPMSGSLAPLAPLPPSSSVGGPGLKKLVRNLSEDEAAEDLLLQEFHRRRLREKGMALEPEGRKKGESGVRRLEIKVVKAKTVGGNGR